jgi:capsid protein
MSAEPGSFEQLSAGMSISSWDPQHPVTAFSEFHKAVLRGIASSLGVSYAALASDLEGDHVTTETSDEPRANRPRLN